MSISKVTKVIRADEIITQFRQGAKECKSCGELKLFAEFLVQPSNLDGLSLNCKTCLYAAAKERQEQNKNGSKRCSKCKKVKPYTLFLTRPLSKDGYHSACRTCTSDRTRMSYSGWTREDIDKALVKQSGLCSICNDQLKEFHADHCHKTNTKRKLLCGNCNTGLGMFQDNPITLLSGIEYLTYFEEFSADVKNQIKDYLNSLLEVLS